MNDSVSSENGKKRQNGKTAKRRNAETKKSIALLLL
jgi:hypothetical protein